MFCPEYQHNKYDILSDTELQVYFNPFIVIGIHCTYTEMLTF
jgi:phosphorylcholine metabolism protein LicD